jgi:hypothetical protein
LGLKGQISELELHTIKARLTAGLVNKARRQATSPNRSRRGGPRSQSPSRLSSGGS